MTASIRTIYDAGRTLKKLRQNKQLTGEKLGSKAGISQSKVSKIETGATLPSLKELKKILNILECPQIIRQQIFAVFELSTLAHRPKYIPIPNTFNWLCKKEANTHLLRGFLFNTFPALLQTAAYREAYLQHWNLAPRELAQRISESIKRQDLLWHMGREYHFIIHEAALYAVPGNFQVQLEQLDRIERIGILKHIKIGIIPLRVSLPSVENTNFILYDTNSVALVVANQELISDDPQDIAEHLKIFDDLNQRAHYNQEARELIRQAAQYFIK
ncbi:MAG TPA: helix-turn-helix transcriptional regulator [Candidatus Saccharimonadales bacterium]|nr:helix-turn-helix transcriptional regulator [Candidatus Saccharimonadales bacterium]